MYIAFPVMRSFIKVRYFRKTSEFLVKSDHLPFPEHIETTVSSASPVCSAISRLPTPASFNPCAIPAISSPIRLGIGLFPRLSPHDLQSGNLFWFCPASHALRFLLSRVLLCPARARGRRLLPSCLYTRLHGRCVRDFHVSLLIYTKKVVVLIHGEGKFLKISEFLAKVSIFSLNFCFVKIFSENL